MIPAILGAILALMAFHAGAMGIRSFVALPIETGGTVVRLVDEYNGDRGANSLDANLAYGLGPRQTLFFRLPYRHDPGSGGRWGDLGLLYRHILWQDDSPQGTRRLGLLGGVAIPTDPARDAGLSLGAVATLYRHRHEWDLDALWVEGLENRPDQARYDLAWQYRLSPAEYPEWGSGSEWDLDLELGSRWQRGGKMVHQATLGIQSIRARWVLEGALVRDLNASRDTRYILSVRFHY